MSLGDWSRWSLKQKQKKECKNPCMEPLEEITGERERARQFADPNLDVCYLATVTAEEQLKEKHTKIWILGATGSLLPVFFGRTGGRSASGTQSGRDVGCALRTHSLMRVTHLTISSPLERCLPRREGFHHTQIGQGLIVYTDR